MDLFIINRYRDPVEELDIINQETVHLEKLKQIIEQRKATYASKNTSEVITLTQDKLSINKSYENVHIIDEHNVSEAEVTKISSLNKETRNLGDKSKQSTEFKVLGGSDFEKKTKVARLLPYWLSHPFIISTDLQNLSCPVEEQSWLNNMLKSSLLSEGLTNLFPVQKQVVPFIINEHRFPKVFRPHDICVSAPTGSGKTLSFVLPIIQVLMDQLCCHVRALIVLPVQELAMQVAKVFKKYCSKTHLRVALLSGSTPLHQEQQNIMKHTESSGWVTDVDIIVCTAGRLVEHIQNTEGFSLKYLNFLVIDEADRIMEHIQNDWLYHVDKHIKSENQIINGKIANLNWHTLSEQTFPPHKLLFSATLSQDPEKLEQWSLFQPKLFSAAPTGEFEYDNQIRQYTTPAELKEQIVVTSAENKPLVLYHFLVELKWDKILCFTNSSETAHRLTVLLNIWGNGQIRVAELSAALDRSTRETVLKKFTHSEINVLIGTDALARGIDIPDCNYVISYDPPRNIKTYIHRVGRTGRAGKTGEAVTVLLPNQTNFFKELIVLGGKSEIPQIQIESSVYDRLSESYRNAIMETKKHINSEVNTRVQRSIEIKRKYKRKIQKVNK